MDIRKLQRAIVDGLEDVKAQNIVVFNTEHLSPLFERVIVASGTSNRQTKALAASVRDAVRSRGMEVLRMEGEDNGEWIIVDCGAAVAHIMQPGIREYYHLEEIWGGKAVRMKIDTKTRALPKGGESDEVDDDDDEEDAPPARQPAARKTAAAKAAPAGRAPVKKAVAGKSAAKKAPAKATGKSAPRHAAPAAEPHSRKLVINEPARKAPAKAPKAAAKKAPARKTAASPAPARKAPAKKAAPRRA
ncbi:ribosome silencing factor [Aquincola sp. MAHUQ-54]|uniref:Ribosomal silencing factor RsfS n=1 Tax=Aquincola agrisoli TaxID=3119538 RepID=A0AAW9QAV2_9BURK